MKKIMAAVLAVLLLTGCQKTQTPAVQEETSPVPEETVQTAPVEQPAEEPSTEEFSIEIAPTEPSGEVDYTVEQREGLVEDAIGYILEYPVFSDFDGAEAVNQFYADLTDYLENYIKETVYAETMERGTVTDVYGQCDSVQEEDGLLTVDYAFSVQYRDTEETEINCRTDCFDMTTGERVES